MIVMKRLKEGNYHTSLRIASIGKNDIALLDKAGDRSLKIIDKVNKSTRRCASYFCELEVGDSIISSLLLTGAFLD